MVPIQPHSLKLQDTQNLFVMIEILMAGALSYTREKVYHVENLAGFDVFYEIFR